MTTLELLERDFKKLERKIQTARTEAERKYRAEVHQAYVEMILGDAELVEFIKEDSATLFSTLPLRPPGRC